MSQEMSLLVDQDSVIRLNDQVLFSVVDRRVLIFRPRSELCFGLDALGTKLWLHLQLPRQLGELLPRARVGNPGLPSWRLASWVLRLARHGLLEIDPEAGAEGKPGSRRLELRELCRVACGDREPGPESPGDETLIGTSRRPEGPGSSRLRSAPFQGFAG